MLNLHNSYKSGQKPPITMKQPYTMWIHKMIKIITITCEQKWICVIINHKYTGNQGGEAGKKTVRMRIEEFEGHMTRESHVIREDRGSIHLTKINNLISN